MGRRFAASSPKEGISHSLRKTGPRRPFGERGLMRVTCQWRAQLLTGEAGQRGDKAWDLTPSNLDRKPPWLFLVPEDGKKETCAVCWFKRQRRD